MEELGWKKVITLSVNDVEYIVCEEYIGKRQKVDKDKGNHTFRLKPEKVTVNVPLKLMGRKLGNFTNLKMMQFPVNSNIATTGHKLQGQTKKALVVGSWFYGCPNWVYVVISRVKTLSGLFITEKLIRDLDRYAIKMIYWLKIKG